MRVNQGLKLGREGRRLQTQKEQRLAKGNGLHPRRLAREIARRMEAGKDWRTPIAAMPAQGQKYLHPERHR